SLIFLDPVCRYSSASSRDQKSPYFCSISKALAASTAASRSRTHSRTRIGLKLYEQASITVARIHPEVEFPATNTVSIMRNFSHEKSIVPKKPDARSLVNMYSPGRGANSFTIRVNGESAVSVL